RTIKALMLCALVCVLSIPSFAATNKEKKGDSPAVESSLLYSFKVKGSDLKVTGGKSPFNQTTNYTVRIFGDRVPTGGGNYTNACHFDITSDYGTTPLTAPGTFSLTVTLQAFATSTVTFTMTITAGNNISSLQNFNSDHYVTLAADLVSYSQSATSYGGIPIVLWPQF
ncbi:MAG: hypothetical protein ABIN95_01735, partial [Mucilaginibacter sp.]